MRVVHVHRIAGIGGSERHLLTLLPALAAAGTEVAFVGLDGGGDSKPFYDELERAGVPYRVASVRSLRRAIASFDPDLVHTHLVHADVFGAVAAGRRPLVSTKHNDDPFRSGLFRFVERALTRRTRAVITITEALARFQIDRVGLPRDKLTVVHYGMDAPPPAWAGNPPLVLPDSARVMLGLGRLVPQRGYDVALHAFAAIRESHPDAVLVIVGEVRARSPRTDPAGARPGRERPAARSGRATSLRGSTAPSCCSTRPAGRGSGLCCLRRCLPRCLS